MHAGRTEPDEDGWDILVSVAIAVVGGGGSARRRSSKSRRSSTRKDGVRGDCMADRRGIIDWFERSARERAEWVSRQRGCGFGWPNAARDARRLEFAPLRSEIARCTTETIECVKWRMAHMHVREGRTKREQPPNVCTRYTQFQSRLF